MLIYSLGYGVFSAECNNLSKLAAGLQMGGAKVTKIRNQNCCGEALTNVGIITCTSPDVNGKVLTINWSDMLMTGSLNSVALNALTSLTRLELYYNNLRGPLPRSYPPNFEYLDIENCGFNGTIPTFSEPLSMFWGTGNLFTGQVPQFPASLNQAYLTGLTVTGTVVMEAPLVIWLDYSTITGLQINDPSQIVAEGCDLSFSNIFYEDVAHLEPYCFLTGLPNRPVPPNTVSSTTDTTSDISTVLSTTLEQSIAQSTLPNTVQVVLSSSSTSNQEFPIGSSTISTLEGNGTEYIVLPVTSAQSVTIGSFKPSSTIATNFLSLNISTSIATSTNMATSTLYSSLTTRSTSTVVVLKKTKKVVQPVAPVDDEETTLFQSATSDAYYEDTYTTTAVEEGLQKVEVNTIESQGKTPNSLFSEENVEKLAKTPAFYGSIIFFILFIFALLLIRERQRHKLILKNLESKNDMDK